MNIKTISLIIIGLLAIVVIPSSCSVVNPGQRGIAVTMGHVSTELYQEGVVWHLPYGITTIQKMDVKQWTAPDKTACFSADLQTVEISLAILYRLPEAQLINLFRNYNGSVYDSLIKPRMEDTLKQITAGYKAEELVKQREIIRAELLSKLREQVGELAIIADVTITNIDLTDELEKAIETKQVMEQSALSKTYELQKEQKEAEITIVKATAEAESVRIKGEALKGSPEVIQLEIAKKWNGVSPTSVVVTQGGANVLLPLK